MKSEVKTYGECTATLQAGDYTLAELKSIVTWMEDLVAEAKAQAEEVAKEGS